MRFVVYEIWTDSKIVEANSLEDAYVQSEPIPRRDLALANWHVVPVDVAGVIPPPGRQFVEGGLNYRQVEEK